MTQIPDQSLVVVADGTGARYFEATAAGDTLVLRQTDVLGIDDVVLDGPSGSRPNDVSPRENDEATFAKHLAQRLNEGALNHKYAHLVLVADPQTLGSLRPQLHKEVQSRIVKEIAKTLTNSPLADIEKALSH